jgi:thiol-disulfide isomerase/thioredoxin
MINRSQAPRHPHARLLESALISRRRLLQTGLSLAALPGWAHAANEAPLKTATGPDWAAWTGPTPPLVLPDLGGREQKLSAWRGSVVIVSFWATWCEPCRDEIPLLSTMAKRHREEGLRLVAVNVGEPPAKISAFLKKTPVTGTVLHDRNSTASKKWEAAALPANYLVDRAGTIRYWHLGELDWKSHSVGGVVTRMLRS